MKDKNINRIGRAVLEGWCFDYFSKALNTAHRHSVYIKKPNAGQWYAEKTDGTEKDWVKSLLDVAGVPE